MDGGRGDDPEFLSFWVALEVFAAGDGEQGGPAHHALRIFEEERRV